MGGREETVSQTDLGQRIREARVRKGISQEVLGQLVGATGDYISMIETGRRKPSIPLVSRFADALDLNVNEMVIRLAQQGVKRNGNGSTLRIEEAAIALELLDYVVRLREKLSYPDWHDFVKKVRGDVERDFAMLEKTRKRSDYAGPKTLNEGTIRSFRSIQDFTFQTSEPFKCTYCGNMLEEYSRHAWGAVRFFTCGNPSCEGSHDLIRVEWYDMY